MSSKHLQLIYYSPYCLLYGYRYCLQHFATFRKRTSSGFSSSYLVDLFIPVPREDSTNWEVPSDFDQSHAFGWPAVSIKNPEDCFLKWGHLLQLVSIEINRHH